MRITNWLHREIRHGFQRISVDVEYADGSREEVWFEMPDDIPACDNGNPWLALMIPLAAASGEDIRVDLPVDPYLLQNAETLLPLWAHWYPHLAKRVRILADTFRPASRDRRCRLVSAQASTASLPSCGILSAGSISMCSASTCHCGNETPETASQPGWKWQRASWAQGSSGWLRTYGRRAGARFRGRAMPAERRSVRRTSCSRGFAGPGWSLPPTRFRCSIPGGLHPLTVPLYSTSRTRIVYEGTSHTRSEKIEAIADHPVVRENLHVCYVGQDTHGQDDTNCGRCEKCVRTMVVLDILGRLRDFRMFDHSSYRVELASRMDALQGTRRSMHSETLEMALRQGRLDIVRQIDISLRRSKRAAFLKRFEKWPVLWRLPHYYWKRSFGELAHLHRIERLESSGAA